MTENYSYSVGKLLQSIKIDANWHKSQWNMIKSIDITNYMGELPDFFPTVSAKMMYDDANLYLIFRVQDRFVRCITQTINGPVWEDSCVEFFFAPDSKRPERYFNLEINSGGTPLLHYNIVPRKESIVVKEDDIKRIEIAHSLPKIVDPEISEPVTWTIECRIPLKMLAQYSDITSPAEGVTWKANFYKIAMINSNPHYLTWSFVQNSVPDFHLPAFFGNLNFM